MTEEKKLSTPLLDELETGPWPSFVKEMKKEAHKPITRDAVQPARALLRGAHQPLEARRPGGVMGYGGGVIGRYSDLAEEFPGWRSSTPSGSTSLRVGSTPPTPCAPCATSGTSTVRVSPTCTARPATSSFLGGTTESIEPVFADLTKEGWDLGGSGSNMRTPSCCVGPARCEWACYDTLDACYNITQHWQDELHRPFFPYKYKFKFAGCPNDCVASIARADCS